MKKITRREKVLGAVLVALVLTVVTGSQLSQVSNQLGTQIFDSFDEDSTSENSTSDDSENSVTCAESSYNSDGQKCEICKDTSGNAWENCWEEGTNEDSSGDSDESYDGSVECKTYDTEVDGVKMKCETCYGADFTTTESCWATGGSDSADNDGGQNVKQECREYYEGDQKCMACPDSNGNENIDCWYEGGDDWNNNVADEWEVNRQKNEMKRNLSDSKNNLRDLAQFQKESEYSKKDAEQHIQTMNKLIDRIKSIEGDTDKAEDALLWLEDRIERLDFVIAGIPEIKANIESDAVLAESTYNTLSPGVSTWDDLNAMWGIFSRGERNWIQKDALHKVFEYLQEQNEIADWLFEVQKMVLDLSKSGGSPDECVDEYYDLVDTLTSASEGAEDNYEEIEDALSGVEGLTENEEIRYIVEDARFLMQDMQWAVEDFREIMNTEFRGNKDMYYGGDGQRDGAWECMERSRRAVEESRRFEEAKKEIVKIKETLEVVADLVGRIKTTQPKVTEALEHLKKLYEKAVPLLDILNQAAESGNMEQVKEYFWKMQNIGEVADKALNVIRNYCEHNQCNLEQRHWDVLHEAYQDGPRDYRADFNEVYVDEKLVDDFMAKFEQKLAKIVDDITAKISESVMKKIMDHVEKGMDKILTNLMGNLDVLGDRGSIVAENSTGVYDKIDVLGGYDLSSNLSGIVNEMKESVFASTTKDAIASTLDEISTAVQSGEDTSAAEGELKALLEQNEKDLALVDKVEYKDVKLKDNEWYYGPVIDATGKGIFQGYGGDRAGEFGPGNTMNIAEAAKTFLEASGIGGKDGVSGEWYEAYRQMAKERGLSIGKFNDWGQPIKRKDLATLIYELGEFSPVSYNGEYSDVSANDPAATVAATLNEEEIITGTGDGRFDGNATTNRAEVSAMVTRFMDATQADRVFDDLDSMDLSSLESQVSEPDPGGWIPVSDPGPTGW